MNARSGNLVNRIFERAPFIRSLGIDLISFGDGWCETRVNVRPVLNDVAQPLVIVPGTSSHRVSARMPGSGSCRALDNRDPSRQSHHPRLAIVKVPTLRTERPVVQIHPQPLSFLATAERPRSV